MKWRVQGCPMQAREPDASPGGSTRHMWYNQLADVWQTQSTKFKVVGTFHVPSTQNPGKRLTADGTAERACYF